MAFRSPSVVVALLGVFFCVAAAPADEPSSQPATQPIRFEYVLRNIDASLRPPRGRDWTSAELSAFSKAVGDAIAGKVISIDRVEFTYHSGNDADLHAASFKLYGVTWSIGGKAKLDDRSRERARRAGTGRATRAIVTVGNKVTCSGNSASTTEDRVMHFSADFEDASLR